MQNTQSIEALAAASAILPSGAAGHSAAGCPSVEPPPPLAGCLYDSLFVDVRSPEPCMPPTRPRVRKNLRLNQAKLDRARRILGTATETETVEQTLDLVAFRQEVSAGVRRLAGSKSLRDPFARG
jgi:hypothetical protein